MSDVKAMSGAKPAVLVTGFAPFDGSSLNPSQAIVEALDGVELDPAVSLHTALLPVETQRVADELERLWQRIHPSIAIHFGESAKADRITLERVALNLLDFDIPDNAGRTLTDQPIDPDGPAARFATLPVRALIDELGQRDIAATSSLSAGAYLCNQCLYASLGFAERRGGGAVGFVHVPSLAEQVRRGERSEPAMPLDALIEQARSLITLTIRRWMDDESA